jgi:hypothetical protein
MSPAARRENVSDLVRIGTIGDQVGDPMSKGFCLARTGTRNYQQRTDALCLSWLDAVFDRFALL